MSWRKRSEEEIPDETHVWLYDKMFDEIEWLYTWDGSMLDPDYTHWMYDEESPDEPSRPEDLT